MGNSFSYNSESTIDTETETDESSKKKFKNFYEVVDHIATYYILTMDFKSLSKLVEKEYCDKLVVLTSDIIQRYFNDTEITFLAQRIEKGIEVNKLDKEQYIYFNKDILDSLDVSNDTNKSIKKKRVCIGIAKFYIKIAHIFAAIIMTINPVYKYKDESGQYVTAGLMEKESIPKNVGRTLVKLNICDDRINALKKADPTMDEDPNINMKPDICAFNETSNNSPKGLNEEPGIPELMNLYYDDDYDYSNGTFKGMTDATKEQFMKDLALFHEAFTGREIDETVTKFSDIKLRDYNATLEKCKDTDRRFKTSTTINKKNKLFIDYADHIREMMQTATDNQNKLLAVINTLFTYITNPHSGKRVIRINPKLNDTILQQCVEKSRQLISKLYIECEEQFNQGIKLYEAIAATKEIDTLSSQVETMEKEQVNQINNASNIMFSDKKELPIQVREEVILNQGIAAPSAQLDTPSTQLDTPSTQLDTPSAQLDTPSTQLDTPSTKLDTPSTKLDSSYMLVEATTTPLTSEVNSAPLTPINYNSPNKEVVKIKSNEASGITNIVPKIESTPNLVPVSNVVPKLNEIIKSDTSGSNEASTPNVIPLQTAGKNKLTKNKRKKSQTNKNKSGTRKQRR